MTLILIILTTHWFADFVCQTDWQATNKSKVFEALLKHVITYSAIFLFVLGITGLYGLNKHIFLYVLINFLLHILTDFITSRVNTRLWASGQRHNFFVSIGFDQLIHQFCLILTIPLLG